MQNRGAKNYRELRVWESARAVKRALYQLTEHPAFDNEKRLSEQIRESAASAASHISEGFGRFEPLDHARFLRMGKASLIECQNHLVDATDRGIISDDVRQEHTDRIAEVLRAVGALIAYLQSPDAKRNAERIKRQGAERRRRREKQ